MAMSYTSTNHAPRLRRAFATSSGALCDFLSSKVCNKVSQAVFISSRMAGFACGRVVVAHDDDCHDCRQCSPFQVSFGASLR